jgi:hypothetical protein
LLKGLLRPNPITHRQQYFRFGKSASGPGKTVTLSKPPAGGFEQSPGAGKITQPRHGDATDGQRLRIASERDALERCQHIAGLQRVGGHTQGDHEKPVKFVTPSPTFRRPNKAGAQAENVGAMEPSPPIRSLADRIAQGLSLIASPAFAGMAVAVAFDRDPIAQFCGEAGSRLGGMALMYGLMTLAHLGPWIRLIGQRQSRRICHSRRSPSAD